MAKMTTTGKLRKVLVESLERAAKGDLPMADGRNIIGLANQITSSLAVELKVRAMQIQTEGEASKFGKVEVCDD